jgi:mannose-6-phosphate isomerase-like protein (cupin superfamily)
MGARVTGNDGTMDETAVRAAFARDGLEPSAWANGAGDRYGSHSHPYHKVLYCVRGSITFRLAAGEELALEPGDRLDIEPDTEHAAIVGPDGVMCLEAAGRA